jgi:hypothetical protein
MYWANPSDSTWSVLEQRIVAAGYTDSQVQAAWLKEADFTTGLPSFETYAHTLAQELTQITSTAAQRFPNLRQVFISARSYAGYAGIYPKNSVATMQGPNPEPWAYETGFADKWVVAQSVANPSQRPWIGWGPYFWTDGTRGRADGLQWLCSDTIDGTHPSSTGLVKINSMMRSAFVSSAFTPWFTGSPVQNPGPSPAPLPSPVATPHVSPLPTAGATPPVAGHSPNPVHQSPRPVAGGATPPVEAPVIGGVMAAAKSLSPAEGVSLLVIGLIVIGGLLTAFATLVLGRRPLGGRRRTKPLTTGTDADSEASVEPEAETPETPVLAGKGSGTGESKRGDQHQGP